MSTYKAVIIGLTGIGARRPDESDHLPLYGAMPRSHAAAYHRHPQTDVMAVCDIRQEALDAFRHDWHDVWPDVRTYTDYRKMLSAEAADLVSVVTPDHLHADITVDAANGSAQAILCEKPIATCLADADRMIAAAEANQVLLSIEHTRRWSPIHHAARELVRSGDLGRLRAIYAHIRTPRAMLFRNGTHLVDMVCFFAESEPSWVFAELEEGFDHFTEYKSDGGHDPATDPAVSGYIHFANGVRAFYDGQKVAATGSGLELVCDRGTLTISDLGLHVSQPDAPGRITRAQLPIPDSMQSYQMAAVTELIDLLENGGDPVSPASEARKTLEIILAMLRSHELGNVRVDLPLE